MGGSPSWGLIGVGIMRRLVCGVMLVVGCSSVAASGADMKLATKAPEPAPAASPWDFAFGSALMSDYNFRGITQSNHKPSVAAYFEPRYNFTDSLQAYVGVSGESISFPDRAAAEIDFYGGIRSTFGKLAFDFGAWEYYYPGGQCFNDLAVGGPSCAVQGLLPNGNVMKADVSFWEVYGKASYTVSDNFSFGGSAFYSPSVLNSGADGTYAAANAKYTVPNAPLPAGVGVFISADVGHWFLGTSDSFYFTQVAGVCGGSFPTGIPYKSYTNWDAGLAFTYKVFTLDLRYFDTNLNKGDCNAFTSDHTATGIATTPINPFPAPGSSWCGASFIAKLSVDMTAAANLK
jgi:Bacterial protein of unknown function (Gcw_chp)